ncbi:PAS domain-containing protein [uncultured Flavobacterium sp.]|uniref:PAS domain-containing protein n=1 Tax=uncultured Flavobacterium sp. TaxID=165435 RepID=UPI0025D6B9EA|nr:PAS domain-containing protein [uncultured Flavobacterium sp.]
MEKAPDNNFLSRGGGSGEIIRSLNWADTPLGAPETWPLSLRTSLGILLNSAFPMILFWGEDMTCFYNDAFRPSLGNDGKHPGIGKKGRELWADVWDFAGPLFEQVLTTGEPVWFENQLVPFFRNGKTENIYWNSSYSPIYDDAGKINGVFVACTETTEKVHTERKLTESEKHFESLIREAAVGIVVLHGDDHIVEVVNDAYLRLTGRDYRHLVGKPLFDAVPEADPFFRRIIEGVKASGNPYHLNNHAYSITTNGSTKEGFLNLIYQPYKNSDGKIGGVMALCHDVTANVLAQKRVEESEQRVLSVVESAPFPIGVYMGREMRIVMANQSLMDVWGKGNDVIGKTYHEMLPELDGTGIYQQLDNVFTTGIPYHARNQQVDLVVNGILQPFFFNYSFTPLYDADGAIYGVMNTAAEVTDLVVATRKIEQSEKNFRNIILRAPLPMCIMLGPRHVVEIANEAMIGLWGKPAADVMNKPVFEGLPDAREQGLEQLLDNVYNTGERFVANEMPVNLIRHGKAETVYQNFVYEPYRDADGTVLGVLAITVDVTAQVAARRQIEEVVLFRTKELEIANNNLKKSNAELAQFAYIASHDLQEPLRKISTFTQMIETRSGDRLDEQSRNYFEKIKNASQRMQTLIRDVLTYSELVKDSEIFMPVDLNTVLEGVISDFELLIEEKGAKVTFEKLPVLDAISLQMSQLFGNLISNSLKFARTDMAPEIHISAAPLPAMEKAENNIQAVPYYKITFTDNGIGFREEYAEKIFNIFQRLHGKSEYEGTGIGLAMCKKIALNHNGDLNAHGSSERGAVFNLLIPEKHFKKERQ